MVYLEAWALIDKSEQTEESCVQNLYKMPKHKTSFF